MIQTLVTELRSVASVVMIPAEQRSQAATLCCWHCHLSLLFMIWFCMWSLCRLFFLLILMRKCNSVKWLMVECPACLKPNVIFSDTVFVRLCMRVHTKLYMLRSQWPWPYFKVTTVSVLPKTFMFLSDEVIWEWLLIFSYSIFVVFLQPINLDVNRSLFTHLHKCWKFEIVCVVCVHVWEG